MENETEEYEKLEDIRYYALRNKKTLEFFTNRKDEFMFFDEANIKRAVAYYNNKLSGSLKYPKIDMDEWEFVKLKVAVVEE